MRTPCMLQEYNLKHFVYTFDGSASIYIYISSYYVCVIKTQNGKQYTPTKY